MKKDNVQCGLILARGEWKSLSSAFVCLVSPCRFIAWCLGAGCKIKQAPSGGDREKWEGESGHR